MAGPGAPRIPFRGRSRLVAWAKVLLPLGALALMSTVFLLAREPREPDIPFARIEEIAREPRMDRPRLSGVAPDGTTVTLTAERIAPLAGRPDAFALVSPRLETLSPEGRGASLSAEAGEADGPGRTLRLTGGVRLESEPDTVLETPGAEADLGSGTVVTGAVTAESPFGTIEAARMTFAQGEGEGARLVFNGGVRLLYLPERNPSPEAP